MGNNCPYVSSRTPLPPPPQRAPPTAANIPRLPTHPRFEVYTWPIYSVVNAMPVMLHNLHPFPRISKGTVTRWAAVSAFIGNNLLRDSMGKHLAQCVVTELQRNNVVRETTE